MPFADGDRRAWPIAVIARRNLRQVPEFTALQLPKASTKGYGFIASARGMAAAAAIHREALVGYGLPERSVEDLTRAVDQFEGSLAEREKNRGRRIGATKGLEAETREARTVLDMLDALVRRWAKGNAVLQRTWEGARLIRHRPGPVSVNVVSATSDGSEAALLNERPLQVWLSRRVTDGTTVTVASKPRARPIMPGPSAYVCTRQPPLHAAIHLPLFSRGLARQAEYCRAELPCGASGR